MTIHKQFYLVLIIALSLTLIISTATIAQSEWPQCEPWAEYQDPTHPGECTGSWCVWYNPFSGPAIHVNMRVVDVCQNEDGSYEYVLVDEYLLKTSACC